MLESITVHMTIKAGTGDQLEQPVTLKEVVDAYNFEAMKKGELSIGEEDIANYVAPSCLGLYRIGAFGSSFKLWVVKKADSSELNATAAISRRLRDDVEQGLCPQYYSPQPGNAVYLWNDNPQLACLKTLDRYDPLDSHPYKTRLYGASVGFQHACPKEHGHPARDLIRELRGLFPKEKYGSAALSLGQAAILLRWASSLPVVFKDGTEDIVRVSIQDGVIVVQQQDE